VSERADADVGQKVLVILETLDIKRTHSGFFRDLAGENYACIDCRQRRVVSLIHQSHAPRKSGQAFNLTFVASNDKNLALMSYGEYLFDHLILFAPGAKGKHVATILAEIRAADVINAHRARRFGWCC
jgi:hypothetical protein